MKVAVFDVCGTLYDANTTFAFLDSYFSSNRKYNLFRKVSKSFIGKLLNYPFYRFMHKDITRILALYFLKGESANDVDRAAQKFVTQVLAGEKKNDIVSRYNSYRKQGYIMVLMSGSLNVLIKHISVEFSADSFFATELENKNKRYTGKISKDQLFDKNKVLQVAYPHIERLIVVSDNKTDLPLFLLADKAYAVCNKKKQSAYWRSKNIPKLELLE